MKWPKEMDATTVNAMCFNCEKSTNGNLCSFARDFTPPDGCIIQPIMKDKKFYTWRILRCPHYKPEGEAQVTSADIADSILPLIDNLYAGYAEEFERRKQYAYTLNGTLRLLGHIRTVLQKDQEANAELLSRISSFDTHINRAIRAAYKKPVEDDEEFEDIEERESV